MNDTFSTPYPASPRERTTGGLTPLEQRRITRWIGEAFAILCVRVSGPSRAEKQLRLGFEAILRELGTSPLRAITTTPLPAYAPPAVTSSDLRLILKALDSCLALFCRYGAVLNQSQRRIEELIRSTRTFALEELRARTLQRTDARAADRPRAAGIPHQQQATPPLEPCLAHLEMSCSDAVDRVMRRTVAETADDSRAVAVPA